MEIDASKKKDGDDEAEALWYEYLGDWSKLRRKNIHAAVLALAAVRAKISKSTTIVSDLLLHGFFMHLTLIPWKKESKSASI